MIKTNHDCGGVVVCKDKSTFDADAAREKLNRHLATNYYLNCREWPYKNVKRKIFAEVYFDSIGAPDSIEYKTTCFNGKVGFVTICKGIAHSTFDARSNDHYDVKFKHMPWYAYYKNAEERPEKPEQWDELISVCEKLSEGIPYLRVDSYIIDGQIYIGELTFYTWGGFVEFTPPEWDRKLGKHIKLPDRKNKKGK